MDILEQYLNRADEIIGDRTKDEIRYDNEVLRWLRKKKGINKDIKKANQKYPKEAIQVDENNINDVAAHYEYQLEHENIMRKMSKVH